jgi:hypothetical protein
MKVIFLMFCWTLLISVLVCSGLMSAQSPDQGQNLFACKNGWDSCIPSALTQADKNEVVAARHEQSVSDCENVWTSCDRSTLSAPELAGVAVATHRNMVSDCWSGVGSCDHAKLTAPEAAGVAVAQSQRNVSDCWNGWLSCNLSTLTPSERSEVTVAQHRRNVSQCWDGWADCAVRYCMTGRTAWFAPFLSKCGILQHICTTMCLNSARIFSSRWKKPSILSHQRPKRYTRQQVRYHSAR